MVDQQILDKLHPWLVRHLQNTELPPEDLANYVMSLLQADGTREELYQRCVVELQEFMRDSADTFVTACFDEIERLQRGEPLSDEMPVQPPQAPQSLPEAQGGQEEFRQNFRQLKNNNQMQGNPMAQGFPGMPPQGFPGFPPQGFAQGFPGPGQGPFPPNGFPGSPFNDLSQKQAGGYQYQRGGRRGGRGGARGGFHQGGSGGRHYSPLSSINNELSVANRRLVVEKVPEDKLNEQTVRSYFSRFGNLTSVHIDPAHQLAEIEFEGHDQAVAAHQSPDPIFDNRFVKVYWRKKLDSEPEPEIDVEAVRRMQAIKQQQIAEKEEKRKAIKEEIRQALQTQAQLLDEKAKLLTNGAPAEALSEQQKKSDALRERLSALQAEAESLGLAGSAGGRGGYRGGRGAFRGRGTPFRGRGTPYGGGFRGGRGGARTIAQASLDLRPKAVLLKGVSEEKDETLRSHLVSFNHTSLDRQGPDAVLVDFPDRRTAEHFYNSQWEDLGPVRKEWRRVETSGTDTNMEDA